MRTRKYGTFYCFSPPIMIITFIIEIALALFTLWRYRPNTFTRLSILLLVFLATFQLAEYFVCTGTTAPMQWSRLGYVAITLLPPLGIHALHVIRGRAKAPLVYFAYATGLAFVAYFALASGSITGQECLGNYVIFQVNTDLTWLYAIYYYGWVVAGIVIAYQFAQVTKQKRTRQALYGFAVGYAAFLVPTTTANLLNSATRDGIPSIMCGFAVIFALILGLWVLPRVAKPRLKA